MMAAAAFPPNPAAVRFVLELGGDIQARDDAGRTALDWALTLGETEISGLLRKAGAKPGLSPAPPPSAVEKSRSAHEALVKAVAVLEPLSPLFHDQSGCFSCHNNSLPEAALNIALTHGIAVNRKAAAHAAQAALGDWKGRVDDYLLATCATPGFLVATTKGLLGLAEEGVAPNYITDAADLVLSQPAATGGRLAPRRNRHSAAFDGLANRFHGPGDPRPEGVLAAGAARRSESADRSGPRFYSRHRVPRYAGRDLQAARTHLGGCARCRGRGAGKATACIAARRGWLGPGSYDGARCLCHRAGPVRTSRQRANGYDSRVRERRAVPPSYSARRWDLVCPLAELSDFSRISNRVSLMERISSSRRRRHPGLRWHWRTHNKK